MAAFGHILVTIGGLQWLFSSVFVVREVLYSLTHVVCKGFCVTFRWRLCSRRSVAESLPQWWISSSGRKRRWGQEAAFGAGCLSACPRWCKADSACSNCFRSTRGPHSQSIRLKNIKWNIKRFRLMNNLWASISLHSPQHATYSSVSNCTYVWFIIFLSNWFTVCCLFDTYGLFFSKFQVLSMVYYMYMVY